MPSSKLAGCKMGRILKQSTWLVFCRMDNRYSSLSPGEEPSEPTVKQNESSSRSNQIELISPTPTAQFPVNINTANQEELESLPEIDPVTAAKIIEYRELNGLFATIEDIQKVKGIGPKTYEAIKDLIIIGP